MPSLFDCLQSAIDAGLAPAARARAAQSDFQALVAQFETTYPTHVAQAMAGKTLKEAAARGAAQRRHTVIAQLMAAKRNTALIGQATDPSFAPIELIEGKQGTGNRFESVRFVRDGLRRQFVGMIHELLRETGADLIGRVRNRAKLHDVVRELHGQASGSAEAKRMATAVRAAQTRARTLFNAHGGDIGELADFGLPHSHEATKLRAAGFEAWRDAIFDRLAWDRIEDVTTGKPFGAAGRAPTKAQAERFLRNVYDGIETGGWDDRQPSMGAGQGKALFNQRADHRVLHFRDADAWMAYNDQFGASNPFQAIVTHLEGMARDIALMRVLGPNPKAGLQHAIQVAKKRIEAEAANARRAAGTDAAKLLAAAKAGEKARNAHGRRSAKAMAMLGSVTGVNNTPIDGAWATFFAGTRQILTGAQLGSALLSSVTDLWTNRMAARAVGMAGRSVWKRQMDLISSNATRETARQMGYVADTLADAGSASARFMGDVWSPEITSRITNAVLRASGLSFWTDMNRIAFQMEFSGFLASQAGRTFDAIDPALQRILRERDITSADWDALRDPASMFTASNGAKFITPLHWVNATSMPRAQAEGLSQRLAGILEEQLEYAVPSVSIEGRSIFLGDARPGSFVGELMRSAVMYKSFALSVTLNQYRRVMAQPTGLARAQYFATMTAGLTVLGATAVQLKALAAGRDPEPMDTSKFWGRAFMQGGGVGILGDFLASETSRMGGGMPETLTGPVVGLGADVSRAFMSNATRAAQGKDTFIGRDVVNLTRRYTPGTSLWQTRLAMDRLVWDQLQGVLDPDADSVWALQEKNRRRDFGNASWWERGELTPERGPDISNARGAP